MLTVKAGLGGERFLLTLFKAGVDADVVKSARPRLQAFVGVSGGVSS